MNGLIRASLNNPRAVTVSVLAVVLAGAFSAMSIPIDILPIFKSPAVQVLTFYAGMPAAGVEKDITNRMERWTGQAAGTRLQQSRSIVGASIIRNYYTDDIDPNAALTQVNSLASAAIPNLPPGTLPPVILPFDPTGTVPVCLVALDSGGKESEAMMYDVGRYEVRNFIMESKGAAAPVVYGGKLRAVLAYIDRQALQSRNLSPVDVMRALDDYNIFLPTGDAKFGDTDYAIDSNSMYALVEKMGEIPLRTEPGNATYLRDVATPRDSALIQTNIVRVNGERQVYIPVFRQIGSSTLEVVDNLKELLPDMQSRLSRSDVKLAVAMDQSVYVRQSIASLIQEGILGAVLCSLVILVFLGEWRMTVIAVMTIPVAVTAALVGLKYTGNTLNMMTLAGLSLAIGPMVDSAIICLENTHRHLGMGSTSTDAAFHGASEVAMPELVASLCTLLVLSPLALMPGMGQFLFKPMAFAVTFAMLSAYVLSRSFVPARCAAWLKGHQGSSQDKEAANADQHSGSARGLFAKWESLISAGIGIYTGLLKRVMQHRWLTVGAAVGSLVLMVVVLGPHLRREFFPEVDAGALEIAVRAAAGTRIEVTERHIADVESLIKDKLQDDLEMVISELGVTPDWSAAYTPNAGPMDAIVKVQMKKERSRSAQNYVHELRTAFSGDAKFTGLEFAFDAGGMIRGAMNEGKSTPINVRVDSKSLEKARAVALAIQKEVEQVPGIVDCRIMQRLDYPEFIIDVDRQKAAELGFNQADVMKNVIAALNSSIQFNKKNFWIDPVSHNQYYVGVQYPEEDIKDIQTLLDIPVTSPVQGQPVSLRTVVKEPRRAEVAAEINHTDLSPTIDLTMGVSGRDLGHVAADVYAVVSKFGKPRASKLSESGKSAWTPFDPDTDDSEKPKLMEGSRIVLSGEYARMQETFVNLGYGLVAASLLIYFLMVALFRSYLIPLVVMSAVPIGVTGVILMLFITGTAINVQSLLGVIFMVGIVVSNTVLLTDFTRHIRETEHLSPADAISKAASIRVKPIIMTALAALFALLPMALALERGSEANAPLGRAVIGGLLAGLVTTLFVVPALYTLVIRDSDSAENQPGPATLA